MNPCKVLSSYIFGSYRLPIPKSVLGYFINVAAMAFLVSSLPKFENNASGTCLVADTKYARRLSTSKLNV